MFVWSEIVNCFKNNSLSVLHLQLAMATIFIFSRIHGLLFCKYNVHMNVLFLLFRIFEQIVKYCATYSDLIPLSFVLGFYVTIVMTRWWNQYTSIPWPDTFAVFVSANVHGQVRKSIPILIGCSRSFSVKFVPSVFSNDPKTTKLSHCFPHLSNN